MLLLVVFGLNALHGGTYNVSAFGAKGDGKSKDTEAIQAAIQACTEAGGGTVIIPSGRVFITGTLYLRDHVNLHVENGAVPRGSPNIGPN